MQPARAVGAFLDRLLHIGGLRRAAEEPAEFDASQIDSRVGLELLHSGLGSDKSVSELAWDFHVFVATAFSAAAIRAAQEAGLSDVFLSGGVFCNAVLSELVYEQLTMAKLNLASMLLILLEMIFMLMTV